MTKRKEDLPKVTIYTDGACNPNPGYGGWAAILIFEDGNEIELSGNDAETTNNRMELTAIIEALSRLEDRYEIELYSDSQYCLNIIRDYFDVINSNRDLITTLTELKHKHKIHLHHIYGHGGDAVNKMVDSMARFESNRLRDELF